MKSWKQFNETKAWLDTNAYLYGRCHIFALALHAELGYQIIFLWDNEAWFGDHGDEGTGIALGHAYCVDAHGNAFDVQGNITDQLDHLESEYNVNDAETEAMAEPVVRQLVKEEYLDPPTVTEEAECREYIRQNLDKFRA